MIRDLVRRIERLEQAHPPAAELVLVRGGIPGGSLHALVPGTDRLLEASQSESLHQFLGRALAWGDAIGAGQVVVSAWRTR